MFGSQSQYLNEAVSSRSQQQREQAKVLRETIECLVAAYVEPEYDFQTRVRGLSHDAAVRELLDLRNRIADEVKEGVYQGIVKVRRDRS